MHPRLNELLPKFAKKYDLSIEAATLVAEKFGWYFCPQWGSTTDHQLINLLGKVAEFEGIHSHGCN